MNRTRDKELLRQFGNHVREIREKKKYTLEKVALEADVEKSQIYRIEKGKINPTLSTLKLLANALEVELKDLLNF